MTQTTFERVRRIELQLGVEPSHYEPGQAGAAARADAGAGAPAATQTPGATGAGDADAEELRRRQEAVRL
jgi:hypothetical protein